VTPRSQTPSFRPIRIWRGLVWSSSKRPWSHFGGALRVDLRKAA